jgi:hypothetical protein
VLHFLLFLGCVASIEIFLNLNFINSFKKIISIARKVFLVMVDKGMSDNKKEKVIPVFAFQLMKYYFINFINGYFGVSWNIIFRAGTYTLSFFLYWYFGVYAFCIYLFQG